MTHNESHPLFQKDEAFLHEFGTWYVKSANAIASLPRQREMLEYFDNANSLARNVKQQITAELDAVDRAGKIGEDQRQKQRDQIMGRYCAVNDRLWDRRLQLGAMLDTTLSRQDSRQSGARERVPSHIVDAAKSSPAERKAASAFDRLMEPTNKGPARPISLERDHEQGRA